MKTINNIHKIIVAGLFAFLIAGCGEQAAPPAASSVTKPQAQKETFDPLHEDLLAKDPIPGAVGVVEARKASEPGADIVVIGYIGGRGEPLVEGRAIFTLADAKAVTPCDAIPGDSCETPWDACCVSSEIKKASIASVQVVDGAGSVLKQSLAGFGGIKPGATVTVQGKVATGSSAAALIVNASKIYVTPKK